MSSPKASVGSHLEHLGYFAVCHPDPVVVNAQAEVLVVGGSVVAGEPAYTDVLGFRICSVVDNLRKPTPEPLLVSLHGIGEESVADGSKLAIGRTPATACTGR